MQQIRPVEAVTAPEGEVFEFAVDLARKNRDQLGAVHAGAMAGIVRTGQGALLVARENDCPASMLLTRSRIASDLRCLPIIAAAVSADLRRIGHGLSLVEAAVSEAETHGRSFIQAICREDLPSNKFWHAAGFTLVASRCTRSTRAIDCFIWRKPIADMSTSLFAIERPKRLQGAGGRFLPAVDVHDEWSLFPGGSDEGPAAPVFTTAGDSLAVRLFKSGFTRHEVAAVLLRRTALRASEMMDEIVTRDLNGSAG